MRIISISTAAILALGLATSAANAKTYNVAYTSEKTMKKICGGHGSFNSGENSYACTYKNGNIRECNRQTKKCITETPAQLVAPPSPNNNLATQPGILDAKPALSTLGPAPTGTPLGTPPGQIR